MKVTIEFAGSSLASALGFLLVQALSWALAKLPRKNGKGGRASARRAGSR